MCRYCVYCALCEQYMLHLYEIIIFLLSNSMFISGNSSFVYACLYDCNSASIWSTQQYFSHHDTASTWAGTRLWLKWTVGRFDASAIKNTNEKPVHWMHFGQIDAHFDEHRYWSNGTRYFPQKSTNLMCSMRLSKNTPATKQKSEYG